MQTDRRTILSLVALGRITPAEAERLLIAWNTDREGAWIFIACIVSALLAQLNLPQSLPALLHTAYALLPGGLVHQVSTLLAHLWGGMQ